MTIYIGKKTVCGIQLTIDKVWRYVLQEGETLTVKVTDSAGNTIENVYTSADVDKCDKQITVEFTAEQTSTLTEGIGKLTAFMNDLVVVKPTMIYIKGV